MGFGLGIGREHQNQGNSSALVFPEDSGDTLVIVGEVGEKRGGVELSETFAGGGDFQAGDLCSICN